MPAIQNYATLADLASDLESSSLSPDTLTRFLLPASEYVRETIGAFIPETATLKLTGRAHAPRLLFTPALLAVTSITNDGLALDGDDYTLQPAGRHWPDGPFSWLEILDSATHLAAWSSVKEGVELAGLWGYYNRSAATGATVGSGGQSSGAATLLVSDGSKVSPGQVLLIESEQEYVDGYSSPASATTLSAACDASIEELDMADGTQVKVGELARLDFEQVRIRTIQTNKVLVERGHGGTKKVPHPTGTTVEIYRTVTVQRGMNGTSAATHAVSTPINTYQVPAQINYLTRQIAILMLKKAGSGYAGKSGNESLGTVFYFHEFPRDEIDRIKASFDIPRVPR